MIRLNVILLIVVLGLCGCSLSIIHPPSAAAFMEQGDGDLQKNVTLAFSSGHDEQHPRYYPYKSVKSKLPPKDYSYSDDEIPGQITFDFQKKIGNFKIGGGFDWITPYFQVGFVSDYFGVMGWSNMCLWQLEKYEHADFQWGGGITVIEQIPISSHQFRIGLTQHISRNGREGFLAEDGAMFNHSSAPVFYDEVGAGGYIAVRASKRLAFGIEIRYGRDLTYKIAEWNSTRTHPIDRYTVTFNLQWW